MRPTARKLVASAAVVAVAAPAAAALGVPSRSDGKRTSGPALRVTGSAVGLFPGSSSPLRLTIQNRRPFAVVVRSVNVGVETPRGGCRASTLRAQPYSGRFVIRAKSMRRLTLRISMRANAPNACRGARFPLRFRAVAVRRR